MSVVVRLAMAVALALVSASSWAQISYFTLIDTDNNSTTGCAVTLPSAGAVSGIEKRLAATVMTDSAPAQVTQLTLETCTSGSFGTPTALPGAPYPVGLNNGVSGADVVEQAVASNAIAAAGTTVRLYFAAQSATGDDLLPNSNDPSGGNSILFGLVGEQSPAAAIPTLTTWSLLGLILLLAGLISWRSRWAGQHLSLFLLVALTGLVLAATLDGQVNDWTGKSPVATDPQGDSSDPATDLVAAFADVASGILYLRLDVANVETELPAITSANATTFTVGSAGSFTVTTTGSPTPTLSRGGVALPAGVTFVDNGDGTGALSGTPAAGAGGSYALTFTATNAVGSSPVQNFTLNVNQAPAITSATAATFTVGSPGSFTVTTTGSPTPTLSQGGAALPAGVTFVDNGDGTGALSGTPAAGAGGSYALTFIAANGILPNATQNFTLTVQQPPSLSGTPPSPTTVGQPYSFSFTVGGSPTPALTVTTGVLPTGMDLTGNTLSGTPTAPGDFTGITVTADNGVSPSASVNFGINVVCPVITVNPTILANGVYQQSYGPANFSQVGSTGSTFTWTISAGALPPGLTLSTAGALAGMPTDTGSFSFTVTVTDNFGCVGLQTFNNVLIRPVATNDTYPQTVIGNVSINSSNISYSVTTNDLFPPGTTISAFDTTSVRGGNVTMMTSGPTIGQFTYNPPAGYEGLDSFTYTLGSNGQTATATVNLTVSGMIWFINNGATACTARASGCGRLSNPYSTLAAFQAENDGGVGGLNPSANDNIFVYESGTTYTGSVTLLTGQKLIGQDATASLVAITGLTPGPDSAAFPVMNSGNATITNLTNTVTLNTNTTVRGLSINATTNTGMNDPAPAITGVSVSEVNVVTTTGVAVLLSGVEQSNLTFKSISANGAANGISLTSVNTTSGSFTVTGDGGSTNNSSGGAIQNTSGAGISLSNTQNISLDQMNIQSTGGSGIDGTQVTYFSFTNGTINNSGNAVHESNIAFNGGGTLTGNNISGTLTVTGSTLTNAFDSGVEVQSNNGVVSDANISNNIITSSTSTGTSLGAGVNIVGTGNASTTFRLTKATIANNVISNFPSGAGIQVNVSHANVSGTGATAGIPGSPTDVIAITGNTIQGNSSSNRIGTSAIIVNNGGGSLASRDQTNFNISNNTTLTNVTGTAILIGNNGYADMTGTVGSNAIVANNTVASNGIGGGNGAGSASNTSTPSLNLLTVNANSISQTDGNGILLVARGATSQATNLKITNNNVAAPLSSVRQGIRVDAGNGSSGDDPVCLNISGNTSAPSVGAPAALGIGLRKQGTNPAINDFAINGMAATSTPGIETYVNGLNPAGGGTLLISATSGFSNCVLP